MPFTPAHAAVVLPLIRSRYFSATGLIVGSMTPDFEYFFKMSVEGIHGHTPAGLFYFDLPVAILLAFIFHWVVKKNLIQNLPVYLQQYFQHTLALNFAKYFKNNMLIFIFSALLGGASHIIWDSFTHGNGYFVRELPFYDGNYIPFDGVNYPLWYALQHISTFTGLAIILFYILVIQKPCVSFKMQSPNLLYWVALLVISCVVVTIRFSIKPSDYSLGNFVVTTIAAFLIALVTCGFIRFKTTG